MGQPGWREIKQVIVPERRGILWTPALDYVTPGRLYRLTVEPDEEPQQAAPAALATGAGTPDANVPAPAPPAPAVGAAPPAPNVPAPAPPAVAVGAAPPAPNVPPPAPPAVAVGAAPLAPNVPAPAPPAVAVGAAPPPNVPPPAPPAPPPPILRDQLWKPESGADCTADGDPTLTRGGALILDGCAAGALIAKIGGSTADIKPDKDKTMLFGVGRHCVFSVSDAGKTGSLYLGINDAKETIVRVGGNLRVTICESL